MIDESGHPASSQRIDSAAAQAPSYDALKTFFDISPDLLCAADFDGYLRFVNPAFEKLLGYSGQAWLEKPFIEFVHPDDRASTTAAAASIGRASVARFENRFRCRDGSYKWLAWTAVASPRDQRVYALARDITEAKGSQWQKTKQRELLETVLDSVPASIFWKDRNSVFLGANKRFAQDAGLRHPDELVGRTDYEMAWTQEEADFYRHCDREVMDSGQPLLNIEEPQRQADGREVTLLTSKVPLRDESGEIYGMLGIYMDISKRKRAEKALRESEERHRAVVETATDGFWMIDSEGRILATNDAYVRRSGFTREQILSMRVSDVEADEDDATVRRHIDLVRELGSDTFESHHRTRTGVVWPVEVHASYWERGGYYFAFLHDMSERVALERAIIEASTAEQERIGRDIHDGLGQNLTGLSILAKAEEQRLRQAGDMKAADAVGRLRQHTQSALDQARAMARGLRPVEVSPDGLAYALAGLARQVMTTSGVDCRYLGLPHLAVDDEVLATHLFRIAQEATQNALKHAQATCIELDLCHRPEGLLLTVNDDGRGVDVHLEHGDGMGLKIMRYRANILGGCLSIGAGPQGGTLVSCVVPLRRPAVP
jgi:PAS domain S-box-containing protein